MIVPTHTIPRQGYVNNLNTAVDMAKGQLDGLSLTAIVTAIGSPKIPSQLSTTIRNNAGGHWNHSLYWKVMTPRRKSKKPKGALKKAIINEFGSLDEFYTVFATAAVKVFGSGWAWLVVDTEGLLEILTTANQSNPLIERRGIIPILGIDVWEHAYYLKY